MFKYVKRIFKTVYDIFPILNRPMAVCAVFSCAAVYYMYLHREVSFSIFAIFFIILGVICFLSKNKKLIVISVLFFAVCASAINEFAVLDDLSRLNDKTVEADFVAVEDSRAYEKVTRVTAYCYNSDVIPKNTKFSLHYFFKKDIKCGDKFNATVKLFNLADNEYKAYNLGNSVYMNCRIKNINREYKSNWLFSTVGSIRSFSKRKIKDNYSSDDASVIAAINTGDRSLLSDVFYDRVLTCGVSHIMVISGLHISILLGSIFLFFEKFYYNKYIKSLVSVAAIFMVCTVCGFTLSVLRAGTMFIFSVISPVFSKTNDSFNSLGSSVVLLLFISPLCIFSVAFWLSVLSTAAVVWIAPFYRNFIISKLNFRSTILKSVVTVSTISLIAMIFSAPVSMLVFDGFSLLSPFSFVLLTFPVTIALIFNTLGVVLSSVKAISIISKPLFLCAGLCAKYIRYIIDNLGQLDFLYIKANITVFLIFIVMIIFMICAMYLYKYYIKLTKRNFISEVYARGGNNRIPIKKRTVKR